MKNKEFEEFKNILQHLPIFNISINDVERLTNINSSTLYNYRRGLKPSDIRYKYIMACLEKNYKKELEAIREILKIEQKYEDIED